MSPGIVAKKVRNVGDPSQTSPPDDASKWAVKRHVVEGEIV